MDELLSNYPGSLSNLAVEAFGKYISDLLVHFVTFPQHTEKRDFKKDYILQTCKRLEIMIEHMITPICANEVTQKLLKYIDVTYRELLETVYWQCLDEISPILVSAILHPSVTRIDSFKRRLHPSKNDNVYCWIPSIIFHAVHKLKHLQVLRCNRMAFQPDWFGEGLKVAENLQEFQSQICNDKVLEILSRTCKKLKVLDVSSSHVSDSCVKSILKFEQLEILNTEYTRLSKTGMTNILKGFSQLRVSQHDSCNVSHKFRALGCENLDLPEIIILADNFTNLNSLTLATFINCSLDPLSKLNHLTKLTLKYVNFTRAEKVLRKIGNQLVSLSLSHTLDTDLEFISNNCQSLNCLHLDLVRFVYQNTKKITSPEFKSLLCLNIHLDDSSEIEYIASRCVNIKKLFIKNGAISFLHRLIKRELLKKLEVIFWDSDSLQGIEVNVTESCVISTVVNFKTGTTIHSYRKI
ncbi:uncharacterized protein [Periplaneta americana]|uniref:uncharacterized protein n=1 Tax=Periplaneta americana TaxID=6978 RepID=UPI0037E8D530